MLFLRTLKQSKRSYVHVIVQFYPSRTIQIHLFEGLPNDIVWLSLRLLGCFDHRGFIDIALVVNIELSKGILEAKYILLLKLGIFSIEERESVMVNGCENARTASSLAFDVMGGEYGNTHL